MENLLSSERKSGRGRGRERESGIERERERDAPPWKTSLEQKWAQKGASAMHERLMSA